MRAFNALKARSGSVEGTTGPIEVRRLLASTSACVAPIAPSQLVPTIQRRRVLPCTDQRSVSMPILLPRYSLGDFSMGYPAAFIPPR